MRKTSYRPAQIIALLREAGVLLGQSKRAAETVTALGMAEVPCTRCRQPGGGITAS